MIMKGYFVITAYYLPSERFGESDQMIIFGLWGNKKSRWIFVERHREIDGFRSRVRDGELTHADIDRLFDDHSNHSDPASVFQLLTLSFISNRRIHFFYVGYNK